MIEVMHGKGNKFRHCIIAFEVLSAKFDRMEILFLPELLVLVPKK